MVLNKFAFLTRQGFGKTLTHVPQTFVAGTQSSYASSSSPFAPFGNHATGKFGKAGNAHLHTAFQGPSSPAAFQGKAVPGSGNGEKNDSGLAAYYDAWQKQHQPGAEEKEWKQFQFAKRIGWKTPTAAVLAGRTKEREEHGLRSEARSNQGSLNRAYSASAVDDIRKSDDAKAEAEALARVDEAIAEEIGQFNDPAQVENQDKSHVTVPETEEPTASKARSASPHSVRSGSTGEVSTFSGLLSNETATTPEQSVDDADSFSGHIGKLSDAKRYAEIPPVFESMLVKGLRPTIQAYNGLLSAVIHLPIAKHQVVPKALDVYTDLLRRKVLPDTTFYATLIQLLARRALDVAATKQEMEQRRTRFGGPEDSSRFLFASEETEYDILADDDALANAIKIFESSLLAKQDRLYSSETYRLLVTACAKYGKVDEMIRAYSHMEVHKIVPIAAMFPSMIEAFGLSGDLASVVECYNEYKALAISDDNGKLVILGRKDTEVYTAVIKAYATCGKLEGGERFFGKILGAYDSADQQRREVATATQDSVLVDAFVQQRVDSGHFVEALSIVERQELTSSARNKALATISIAAADKDIVDIAKSTYHQIDQTYHGKMEVAMSILATHLRKDEIFEAREVWSIILESGKLNAAHVGDSAFYAMVMIRNGLADEGLTRAKEAFALVRSSAGNRPDVLDKIDEAIERIGGSLSRHCANLSGPASVGFLRTMIENGGLVSPVTEQLMARLGAQEIGSLSWQDLTLALRIQAEMVVRPGGISKYDIGHSERFAHIMATMTSSRIRLDKHTSDPVAAAVLQVRSRYPRIASSWRNYQDALAYFLPTPVSSPGEPLVVSNDATTDSHGSTIIANLLDNHRSGTTAALNEALSRLRNIRRAGRHPSYIVYAKLITAAAKEGRADRVYDLLEMAKTDMPSLSHALPSSSVRHGWFSILDAMVGACLTTGNRAEAARFHQELLDIGYAPTANTYGLYITTLKESTKPLDEASEAVRIFQRAKFEGVEPSSFLYNALIGKLGKARRIDDCLHYFSEMRHLGIRATSVTYGTVVNALCRVSDVDFAEQLFDEMESMPNYKPRAAPYNSLMQFFLMTKRDSGKVLAYYDRMRSINIEPTMHTYKLLIDTYATLEPVNLAAAEGVLNTIRASGQQPQAVHYASLIHAKGCVLHDMVGARKTFDDVLARGEVLPQACLYQALFESMVANHNVSGTEPILQGMASNGIEMTPYIANTLIHGWATKDIMKAQAIYDQLRREQREPSTYEAMTRAFLTAGMREEAKGVVNEMWGRGYPSAVRSKVAELLDPGMSRASSVAPA